MEEKIIKVLEEINPEILDYNGDNLYKDGVLDSIQVVELIAELEEKLAIEIDPELVVLENFANKNTIISFVKEIMEGQNAR